MTSPFSITNRFRAFFALQYAAVGVFFAYVALYLSSIGLSGSQVGLLLAIMPLIGFLVQPIWGLLSDIYHVHRSALALTSFGVALVMVAYARTTDFGLLLLLTILHAILRAPTMILGNSLALEFVSRENSETSFGSLRLWGSIGFALTTFAVGAWVIDVNIWWILPIYALLNALLGLISLTVPDAEVHGQVRWQEGLSLLFRERTLSLFLVGALLVGATLGIVNNYLVVYLADIAATGWVIGAALAISALFEVPLMAGVPAFVRRWGMRLVFVGGVAALPLRYVLYIFIDQPLLVLPTQVLHSIAMMSLLVVGVLYVDWLLQPKWRASGQALYTAALHGVGPSLGLYISGLIYQEAGITPVWLMSAVVGIAGTVVFAMVLQRSPVPQVQQGAIS